MKNDSKISIIIPVYNANKFIEKAYKGIQRQSVKLPLEIVFVDNNSIDNSYEILQSIAAKDSRVKVFQENKQGVAPARNRGFKESNGDFIHFFDADDELFENALEDLSSLLLENPSIGAAFGKMLKTTKSLAETNVSELSQTGKITIYEPPFLGLKWLKDLSSVVGSATFLYRREVFMELGLYDERLKWNEDTALDIGLGMDYNIGFIDNFIYLYIKHGESFTDGLKKKTNRAFLKWNRLVITHIAYAVKNPQQTEYDKILRKEVYSSIGKMIFHTKGFNERKNLLINCRNEILPWTIPTFLLAYLKFLTYLPLLIVSKFYHYYLLPKYLKSN